MLRTILLTTCVWPLVLATLAVADDPAADKRGPPDADERIRYYSQRVADRPRLYPAYALLAEAYLDKARETGDAKPLAKARAALDRSLEIQANFEAYKTHAAVANYSHRFEDALRWARLAAEALPSDTSITAMMVEAHLALGRSDDAGELLSKVDQPSPDFHLSAARGHWLISQKRYDEAVASFLQAAKVAESLGAKDHAVWAQASAAGVYLDSEQADKARPILAAAAKTNASHRFLREHFAELAEADGRPEAALEIYEDLLKQQANAELHGRACRLASAAGKTARAREHFERAERMLLRAIEAGEVYSLDALANLYCEAGVNLDRAVALARRNLQFKRDAAAQEVLARALEKAGAKSQ